MTRWKAAGIHLLLTGVVVGSLATLMLSTWYSMGLFAFARADRLLLVLAGIDLVAGPLLTLLIFRSGKPGLKLDLSIIAAIQAAFLAYGLATVWQSRPAFLVAIPERFVLVFAGEVETSQLPSHHGSLRIERVPWFGPTLVAAKLPADSKQKQELVEELMAGRDLPMFPKYYRPFDEMSDQLVANSAPWGSPTLDATADATLDPSADQRWVPITSSRGVAVMLIDRDNGAPLGVLDIDPTATDR